MRDSIHDQVDDINLVTTTTTGATTAVSGSAMDLRGFDAAHFALHIGTGGGTGAVFAASGVEIHDSNDNVTFTLSTAVIQDTDDAGTLVPPAAGSTYRLGYKGAKRYIKPVVTQPATSGVNYTITGHKRSPAAAPTANPA